LKRKNQRSKENYLATKYVFLTVAMGCLKLHILEREYAPMKIVYGGKYGKDERTDFYRQGTGNGSENLGVVYRVQQSNGGSERSGLDNANIILGATSFAQGAQENIIALDKSLNNLKYTKGLKIVGKGLYVTQIGIAGYNTYSAWSNSDGNWRTNDGNKWGVTSKAALDLTIGAIAVWGGPVGWVVGGVYFIGDAAGWWGDWGKPTEP
jgi:hypothetical protein